MTVPLILLVAGSVLLHRHLIGHQIPLDVGAAWAGVTLISVAQCVMSWNCRPFTYPVPDVTVAVVVPCYNEDPALLARVLESLRWQTRRPDAVVVTDDGSSVSYPQA